MRGKKEDARQDPSTNSGDMSLMSRCKYVIEADTRWFLRKELYEVKDEGRNTLCFAERQGLLYKTISTIVFLFTFWFPFMVIGNLDAHSSVVNFIALSICAIAYISFAVIVLRPRHLFLYGRGVVREQILRLIHRKVYSPFVGTYMIESPTGELLGYLRRNRGVRNLFQAKMKCYGPDGSALCTIVEPFRMASVVFLILDLLGGTSGRICSDPNILEPTESRVIGKFSGKTIELGPEAHLDGRICLAMGLMICAEMGVA